VILALVATFLLCIAIIFAAVGSLKVEAARLFVIGLLFSAGLSIVPVLILRYLDRRERESPWLFVISILWGGVIATGIALPINTGVILGVERWLAQYPQIGECLGPHGALLLGTPLAAPPIEELTKALGVLLLFAFLRAEFDNVRDGFVYGALVGVASTSLRRPFTSRNPTPSIKLLPGGFSTAVASRCLAWAAMRCLPESLVPFSASPGKRPGAGALRCATNWSGAGHSRTHLQ
jgi:hypothetical protein